MPAVTRLSCSAELRTTTVYAPLTLHFHFPKSKTFVKMKTLHKRRALGEINFYFLDFAPETFSFFKNKERKFDFHFLIRGGIR